MQLSRTDLADFSYFLAIARYRSFSKAARELGVSASALSHAMRGLETRMGVRLFNRTNRSVTLTAAGEQLQSLILGPFDAIGQAVEVLNEYRDTPAGRIRLNVINDAVPLLLGPVLPTYMERYPQIEIDIVATNRMVDVIGEGFDAGIRYGGTVPEDLIAQRISDDVRWVVAGSTDYLARNGSPIHPNDLHQHRCVRVRLGDDRIYHWEFERDNEKLEINVPGTVTIDDGRMGEYLLKHGAGLVYTSEPMIRPLKDQGLIQYVLEDWVTPGPGFHLYYSSHRQLPVGLRLLVDLIRELNPLR